MTETPVAVTTTPDPSLPPEGYGRSAWTRYGMPSNSTTRLYRMLDTLPYIGAEPEKSHSHKAVHLGARALQQMIADLGYTNSAGEPLNVDGTLGKGTARAIKFAQERFGLAADGYAGQATLKALLAPLTLEAEQDHNIPDRLIYGLVGQESAYDPGAVGYTTPSDHGLVQINLKAHSEITMEQAMDPAFSLPYAAERMRKAYKRYRDGGASVDLAWDCAIAQHNSPMLAKEWAETGIAPITSTREEGHQIADYVRKVREFAASAPAVSA